MKINVLPSHVANMIAAGEVVERPASAVKEMMENSIDAGATNITVEIKKGGMTYIRVTDNGCGIDYDQAETAFLRHATSKIKTSEDLAAIYTLGFRGEALASIAAVSMIDLFTKTGNEELGTAMSLEAGNVTEKSRSGCPDGTTIVIKNLFFNTPARMKFLKNDATETAYVTDVVNKMILAHPEVKIKLINNGKTVIQSSGTGELEDSVYAVFGKEYKDNMLKVDYNDEGICVSGLIGNPSIARRDRRHQIFFVNGRSVVSKTANTAIAEAYKNSIMTGKFPVAILNIKINNSLVDVNVHPAKTEVRFSDDKAIYHAVYRAVKGALTNTKYVPEVDTEKAFVSPSFKTDLIKAQTLKTETVNNYPEERYVPKKNTYTLNSPDKRLDVSMLRDEYISTVKETKQEKTQNNIPDRNFYINLTENVKQESRPLEETKTSKANTAKEEALIIPEPQKIPFKYIGQVFDTYIIAESMGKMLLIDQHAAHERLYFEEFLEDYKNKSFQSQVLLIPVVVKLDPIAFEVAMENKDFFEQLGFEMDIFGDNDIVIRMTPYIMEEHIVKDTVSEIVNLLIKNSVDVKKELFEEALHQMACKRAIKGNHALSQKEAESLIERIFEFKDINTCPHGRPIMIEMTKYQLEKQFKRIV